MRLTADEISGLTAEEAAELKAKRQAAVRDTLDAEKKGTGELKLAKTSNLSDLPDKGKARKNLEVYSTAEIDRMMDGKLGLTPLTRALSYTRTQGQTAGNQDRSFAYIDEGGISHAQVEGYVMTSQVVRELKKAERLMGGYNASEKDTIATNLNLYTKAGADACFAALETCSRITSTFDRAGKSPWKPGSSCGTSWTCCPKTKSSRTTCARTANFPTCPLPTAEAKRQACRAIGAAYAEEYQPLLADTGWMHMENSGSGTDTQGLFIRQIGNIVSIQGISPHAGTAATGAASLPSSRTRYSPEIQRALQRR